jgi:hypothetical protein
VDDFRSGARPLPAQSPRAIAGDYKMPYTWQSTIGFQTQFGPRLGFEADLTHWKGNNLPRQRDPNLFFDPVTGYNLNPSAGRPDPKFTRIQWLESTGKADYAAISSGFTRRYAGNWQAGLTYTYMLFMNDNTTGFQYQGDNTFNPDADWSRSTDFQRHTLRLNGLWRLPFGFNVAGAYFFGSGNYYASSIAANPFGQSGQNRYVTSAVSIPSDVQNRFDGPTSFAVGDVVPRNALKGEALHKMDIRASKDIPFPGGIKLGLIAEVFNVFNHANYGDYNAQINSTTFGQPRQNLATAYLPRVAQLAFKITF